MDDLNAIVDDIMDGIASALDALGEWAAHPIPDDLGGSDE